jgi:hypothetical protein
MIFLRRRQSTKQSGNLYCQNTLVVGGRKISCLSKRLKFLSSEGPVDIYKCKDCGCLLRYHTIPLDPKGGVDEMRQRTYEGLSNKMIGTPNLGRFKVSKKVLGDRKIVTG